MDIVKASKKLMFDQTQKNKAPAWKLTELAIKKGKELSKKYLVDKRLVLTSLYLAHTIFDTEIGGEIQKKHPDLSAKFVINYLDKWKVNEEDNKNRCSESIQQLLHNS